MAFKLQVSNSLKILADQLCTELRLPQYSVFQPNYIVTQTEGMNNWVKLQIANNLGIAANCKFLKPNDLINQIYYLLGGTAVQTLSAENLNWILYKLLGDEDFVKKFPTISTYYANDTPDKDVKRMALAEKVADLFDQYQVYRTDMIQGWNDDLPTTSADDEWQKYLWKSAKKLTSSFPDKTTLEKEIREGLTNTLFTKRLQQKMPVIYLFGISLITEYHLTIFYQLARYIDINFLLLNPAPTVYWFEDKSEKQLSFLKRIGKIEQTAANLGNPLLTGWGKITQDTFSMLFKNEDLINNYEDLDSIEPQQDTLLHRIQYSIYENEPLNKEELFKADEVQDGTITINACYSPAREVEALYNFLVQLIDKKGAVLSPHEIVVMVSDIDLYASYIKAIFTNAPYKFRYTIADENYASSDSVSNALHAVLSITEDNFTAEEVVRLLDSSFIRKRFEITDLTLVRNVVNEANIRFGIEGNKEDDSIYISWQYGLQRIMYGICISGSEEYFTSVAGEESFYPLDIVEGGAANEVIHFVYYANALMDSLKERNTPKTIEGWVKYVSDILHCFVCKSEENTDDDYLQLIQQLEKYNLITDLFTEEISYQVFMHSFLATLTTATTKNSFAVGGITFCSLIPMRSIPFKVVALLGLNFDKFPRKENSLGFNLMENKKRKGDRNVKENDKHLFLETLLSAREYLYISYIGQSVKDNSSIPPSTLVEELADYIAASAETPKEVRKQLIIKQPLHGFSEQYELDDPQLYTYLKATKPSFTILHKEKEVNTFNFSEIQLEQLISFFKNPFKGYYNKVLGIYYKDEDTVLRETELFELDTLQQWKLKDPLLFIDNKKDIENLKNKLIKTGRLPLRNMGEVEIRKVDAEVSSVRKLFKSLIEEEEEQQFAIDFEMENYKVKGSVKGVYADKLVVVSWSKKETKYLLEAYIRYIALLASGKEIRLYFISFNKDAIYQATNISKEEACKQLQELVQLYTQGHKKIINFDPYFKINPTEINELTKELFDKVLKEKFGNFAFPSKDNYMNKEYTNGYFDNDLIVDDCKEAGAKLLTPLALLFPEYYL